MKILKKIATLKKYLPSLNYTLASVGLFLFALIKAESMTDLISWTFYFIGGIVMLKGVIKLKGHEENPQQIKWTQPVVLFVMGALFISTAKSLTVSEYGCFHEMRQGQSKSESNV